MTNGEIAAAICAVIGCFLLYWQSRRKFMRLNSNGVEQFSGHLRMLTSTGFDLVLFSVGTGLLITAVFILLVVENDLIAALLLTMLTAYQFKKSST